MHLRRSFASLLRSIAPRPAATRDLIRGRRLVAAHLRTPGGSRDVDDGPGLGRLASALRRAHRIGGFATFELEPAVHPLALEFEGGRARRLRVGRPPARAASGAILVEMDGGLYLAPGRRLRFLFEDDRAEAQAARSSAGAAFSSPTQSEAGARPWNSAASDA